ncbi:carbohydrate ABC transporter substrate-binding protein, CUT1 family [Gracilibacillus ureilyticus]|uniref:Carbohydrate ABC transporter substrate-binding protein, CUT1 family n=1 Tax=Gracilibacillus ureilyticus TaxID=531814 RepID=A0A1H9PLF7_9BACI|nr:ABC transporter substrate-binding protein [Gracilibacillus ureilyticus]SER49008.1 carbohydrate ABC transporter substrate-binding protein, CUT1 family [Gracilibacillus ureilyticus]
MRLKKLKLGFILFFLLLVVACQDSGNETTNKSETTSDGLTTLTVFDSDANPDWVEEMETPVGKRIKEDTGVLLDPEFDIEGGQTKIPLMIASGDYPDMIVSKGADQLVDADALIDLAPLIDEHAPNLKKMLGEDGLNRLKWSEEDPSIYVLTTAPVDNEQITPSYGAWIQHAVVKELDYPKIRTLDDLKNVVKEYKELHPTIDGQKTIGLTMNTDSWRIQSSFLNSGFMMTGGSDDGEYYINPDTYEATLHYRRSIEKEVFKWWNEMNSEGLIDPEMFVQKNDQFEAKLASGRVLATIGPDYLMANPQQALREAGMEERMYGVYPVTLNEEFKNRSYQSNGLQVGWGISITKDCEDPVKAIKFLDYLASEETQIMLNWGIEGEHYEIKDGKRMIPEDEWEKRNSDKDYLKKTGIGFNFARFAPRYGDGVLDSTGQPFTTNTRELAIQNQTDTENEVLKAYGAELWKDLFPSAEEFPVKPWGAAYNISIPANSELQTINQRALDITKQLVPKATLADPSNFNVVWEEYMTALKNVNIDKAEDEYTELIRQKVELWSE